MRNAIDILMVAAAVVIIAIMIVKPSQSYPFSDPIPTRTFAEALP